MAVGTVGRPDLAAKLAEIKLDTRQLFFYVPLPKDLGTKLERVRNHLSLPAGAEEQSLDHITLLYLPKTESPLSQEKVNTIVKETQLAAADHAPIAAKVQGWAYFDGAQKDGQEVTALVALIDAPGLEDLHVDLKSVMQRLGHPDAGTHSYVPHATLTYLPRGHRVEGLPAIEASFTIDKAMLANSGEYALPLKGSLGPQAAQATAVKEAVSPDWIPARVHRGLAAIPPRLRVATARSALPIGTKIGEEVVFDMNKLCSFEMNRGFATGLEAIVQKVADAAAARSPGPIAAPAVAQGLGRLGRGLRNTGLALGAGALAAGALGLGHQYANDQQKFPLVYQPMSSGFGP